MGTTELDFQSKSNDILNPESTSVEDSTEERIHLATTSEDQPLYRRSLRAYLSILFMRPMLKIELRGNQVHCKRVVDNLLMKEEFNYRPQVVQGKSLSLHIGMACDPECSEYGAMLYHTTGSFSPTCALGFRSAASAKRAAVSSS